MLTTKEAANTLGLSVQRIRQLIAAGDLEASKVGRDWVIEEESITRLTRRPPGRPSKGGQPKKAQKKPWFKRLFK